MPPENFLKISNPNGLTYDKRLGVRNVEERPAKDSGTVYDWWTSEGGITICMPDQWEDRFSNMERLPDEIVEIFYMGLKSQPGSDHEKLMTILTLLQMAAPAIREDKKNAFTKLDGSLMNVLDALELLEEFMDVEQKKEE